MEFLKFVDSAKRVSPKEFYDSTIASDNGVDQTWWPDAEPQSFLIFADQAWVAVFPSDTCYTIIGQEEHKGSISELARLLFDWFNEDSP